jgi:hypothetical protein
MMMVIAGVLWMWVMLHMVEPHLNHQKRISLNVLINSLHGGFSRPNTPHSRMVWSTASSPACMNADTAVNMAIRSELLQPDYAVGAIGTFRCVRCSSMTM